MTKSSTKGFVHFFLVLTVALVGFASIGYFAFKNGQIKVPSQQPLPSSTPTNTEIDTSGWNTFTSTLGYSIMYPSTLELVAMKYIPDQDLTPSEEYPDIRIGNKDGFDDPHVRIMKFSDSFVESKNKSLFELATEIYQSNLNIKYMPAKSIKEPKPETFAGANAVSFAISNKGFQEFTLGYLGYEGIYKVVFAENEGATFLIYWTQSPEFDQILSTFKFLD